METINKEKDMNRKKWEPSSEGISLKELDSMAWEDGKEWEEMGRNGIMKMW